MRLFVIRVLDISELFKSRNPDPPGPQPLQSITNYLRKISSDPSYSISSHKWFYHTQALFSATISQYFHRDEFCQGFRAPIPSIIPKPRLLEISNLHPSAFFILVRFFLLAFPQKFHDVVESRTWLISRLNHGGDGSAFFYFFSVDLMEMARPSSSRGEDDREINADSPLVTRLSRVPAFSLLHPVFIR